MCSVGVALDQDVTARGGPPRRMPVVVSSRNHSRWDVARPGVMGADQVAALRVAVLAYL
ncbi:hypothetical protein [Rhodococcus opacus]|uniref:Uncharacterized protein n=1 Tax=Rhodococcus opacus (strain B4) TaxID=632772 RepID=C1ASH6_RHOOB|nr:hypothetical protein [Rhodococcus opacus]BAH48425.1 hypothetical protein ROP_01780 [Rhodococcus opacus B4]